MMKLRMIFEVMEDEVNAKLNVKATIFKDEDFKDALTGNPFRPKYNNFF